MFRYLPEQASDIAPKVDWIHNLVTDLSVFFTVAIVGAMLYFAIKYRARGGKDHETPRIEGSHFLEVVWTVVPTAICIYVATYGIIVYRQIREVPSNALTINVTGSQWKWDFQYDNGKQTTNEFYIPVDTPVKLVLTSQDVLHSFFVPAMRVKSDAINGRYTYVSFKPVKTGEYQVFCTEYCGTSHSDMLAKLHVVPKEEYEHWLNDQSDKIKYKPAELGNLLYNEKGCKTCHSLNGTRIVGPTFLNLYMRKAKFADGTEYTADENYIRESILNPSAHIVESFGTAGSVSPMPPFEGQLDNDQLSALIAFIKTVDGKTPVQEAAKFHFGKEGAAANTPVGRGQRIYEEKACAGCHNLDGKAGGTGPTFKGLIGRTEALADGSEVKVDEAYIKESILDPNVKVVKGFAPGVMPQTFKTILSDQDVADVVEFIKSVK